MRLSNEGWMLLGYAVLLTVIFGLAAGAVIVNAVEHDKVNLIVGNGIYIKNEGGGHYFIRNGNSSTGRGIGAFTSNIPMILPIGKCYQLFFNQTNAANFVIDLNEAPALDCP